MLSQSLKDRFSKIAYEARQMVDAGVDETDLTGKVNYLSIFAKSDVEYADLTKEISLCGKVYDRQVSGNYILLDEVINTAIGEISICRVRSYDYEHLEEGYLDFEVVNYENFKKKYLARDGFSLIDFSHVQLVELRIKRFNVRAYFPDSF